MIFIIAYGIIAGLAIVWIFSATIKKITSVSDEFMSDIARTIIGASALVALLILAIASTRCLLQIFN